MSKHEGVKIVADEEVPAIHFYRDFAGTPAQLMRAHLEPELFQQWIGPSVMDTKIDYWDARVGGSYRYISIHEGEEYPFRGCFHDIGDNKFVQTFTWEGQPDGVSLETIEFAANEDGTTSMHAVSLCGSFAERDAWLSSGMEQGVTDGYNKIDGMLRNGDIS